MAHTLYYSFVCVKRKTLLAVNQTRCVVMEIVVPVLQFHCDSPRKELQIPTSFSRSRPQKTTGHLQTFPDLPLPLLFLARGILLKWVVPQLKNQPIHDQFLL